jgi:hypothetical protein
MTTMLEHPLETSAADHAAEEAFADAHGRDLAQPAVVPPPPAALPPPLPRQPAQNFFAKHWRGEFSLPRSFWINHLLLGVGVGIAIAILSAEINQHPIDAPVRWLISIALSWGGVLLFSIWAAVGVWHAATAYRASGKRFWGLAAKAIIVFGMIELTYGLMAVAIPQASGVLEIAEGDQQLAHHHFKIMSNGTMLDFSGGISFGTAKEFQTMLDAMDNVSTVRINSIGGRIAEAQKISDMIRARGLSTYVTNECVSACTIVFLGGKQRFLYETAKLGFHQSYFPGQTESDKRLGIAREEARLEQFGLSHAFAEHANASSPSGMWYPEQSELLREHVVTKIVQPPPKPAAPATPAWPAAGNAPVSQATPPVNRALSRQG